MRLTERKVCFPQCDKNGNKTEIDYIEIKDKKLAEEKLGQLEDIEEELGIDLITLFKAYKIYTINGNEHYVGFDSIEQDSFGDYYWSLISGNYYFKDYGKIWALTKEELK